MLLKDNHWAGGQDVGACVDEARRRYPGILIELEAADMDQVVRALAAEADVVLLDNMTSARLREAIAFIRKHA